VRPVAIEPWVTIVGLDGSQWFSQGVWQRKYGLANKK
jgi:hypothetical protein